MSAIGCPYNNACAESFFSLLKNECTYRERPKTIQAAAKLVDEYIHFYNYGRIQLTTKMPPMEMRSGTAA
jgi:transposase InsO family protein